MNYEKLEDLVTQLPIYGIFEIVFAADDGKITNEGKKLLQMLFHENIINLKCIECGKEYPFNVKHNITKHNFNTNVYTITTLESIYVSINRDEIVKYGGIAPSEDEGEISYNFECRMNSQHYYSMCLKYHLHQGKMIVCKIGQYPTTRQLKDALSNQYEKILKKYDSFDDYRMHEQSSERNLLAGSCTYLRRVFEKMVSKMMSNDSITEEDKLTAKHFDEKIKLVKSQFDADIQEILSESYDLLSKGIHELNNDEIEPFHDLLSEVINVQLESETEKYMRDQKMKELRKGIRKEHNGK